MNTRTQQTLAEQVIVAKTFSQRSKGLLGRSEFDQNHTMFFPNCTSIHTWFMQFPIDVVFIDKAHTVRAIYEGVQPWRIVWPLFKSAKSVFEFSSGVLQSKSIELGDKLDVVN